MLDCSGVSCLKKLLARTLGLLGVLVMITGCASRIPTPATISVGGFLDEADYVALQREASEWMVPTSSKIIEEGKAWLVPAVYYFDPSIDFSGFSSITIPDFDIRLKDLKNANDLGAKVADRVAKTLESKKVFQTVNRTNHGELLLVGAVNEIREGWDLTVHGSKRMQVECYVQLGKDRVGAIQVNTSEMLGFDLITALGRAVEGGGVAKKVGRKLAEAFERAKNGDHGSHIFHNSDAVYYAERSKFMRPEKLPR